MAPQHQALGARGPVAAATSLICFLIFQDYLSVLLPRGTWSNM